MTEENVVDADTSNNEHKSELRNKIIAIGLNSLAKTYTDENQKMLNEFVSLSWKDVFPTWRYLHDRVRYQLFINHKDSFVEYMMEKSSEEIQEA